jgi:hypothetical protein
MICALVLPAAHAYMAYTAVFIKTPTLVGRRPSNMPTSLRMSSEPCKQADQALASRALTLFSALCFGSAMAPQGASAQGSTNAQNEPSLYSKVSTKILSDTKIKSKLGSPPPVIVLARAQVVEQPKTLADNFAHIQKDAVKKIASVSEQDKKRMVLAASVVSGAGIVFLTMDTRKKESTYVVQAEASAAPAVAANNLAQPAKPKVPVQLVPGLEGWREGAARGFSAEAPAVLPPEGLLGELKSRVLPPGASEANAANTPSGKKEIP